MDPPEPPKKAPAPRPVVQEFDPMASNEPMIELENKAAAPIYDMVRQVPQVVDGIRCHCGCAGGSLPYTDSACIEPSAM